MSHNTRYPYDQRAKSRHGVFGGLLRFVFFLFVLYVIFSGGLWLLAAAFGIAVGAVSLLISLAPVIIVVWLAWLLIKAILV